MARSRLQWLKPVINREEANLSFGASDTQFDITNPTGTTFRYTWDGTGTDPNINEFTVVVGDTLVINGDNFNAGNNLTAQVTGSGDNYFEVTNAGGVAESNKTLGATGSITTTGFYSTPVRVSGLDFICFQTGSAGNADCVLKFQGSLTGKIDAGDVDLTSPDFTAARSLTNFWDFCGVFDEEDGAFYSGDTGIGFAGTDEDNFRNLTTDTDGLTWMSIQVTDYTAGDIVVNMSGFTVS